MILEVEPPRATRSVRERGPQARCPPRRLESVVSNDVEVQVARRVFKDPFCFLNTHDKGTFRFANATGTVDGATFVQTNIEEFAPTLQSDSSGSVQRCS